MKPTFFQFLIVLTTMSLAQAVYAGPIPRPMDPSIGAILRADGRSALRALSAIENSDLEPKDRRVRSCIHERLSKRPRAVVHGERSLAVSALNAYRIYWQESLISPSLRMSAERQLVRRLSTLLHRRLVKIEDAEPFLDAALRKKGLYSLEGKTGRLHELMIWTSQRARSEKVRLPEGEVTARVHYLDHFMSRGWSSYFTCDLTGTGGWTNEKGLFVVVPAYESLSDEDFRVNFLAHESQHLADRAKFPKLLPWELEYRAKLAELALAVQTREKILSRFSSSQGDDQADAHSYANKRVLAAIRRHLRLAPDVDPTSVPVKDLQQAAADELKADTLARVRV